MTAGSHEPTTVCGARYPLLQRIAVSADGLQAQIPPDFIHLLLSVIEADTPQPLCVMLPSRGHAPRSRTTARQRRMSAGNGERGQSAGQLGFVQLAGHAES
jgi:hypothetical protein